MQPAAVPVAASMSSLAGMEKVRIAASAQLSWVYNGGS
jgi:hypothetical protein